MGKHVASAVVLIVAASSLIAWQLMPASGDDYSCTMAGSQPTSGTLQLEYLRPSSAANPDRNDYKVTGTLRWDDQRALDCYAAGTTDWAYEHNITFGQHIDRKIWNDQLGQLGDAEPYIDTTASDGGGHTDLSFGLFRPERLRADTTYGFSYETFLPKNPDGGKQWILLQGQVLEKNCPKSGPWCVGLNPRGRGDTTNPPLIGWTRGFDTQGTTCWAWHIGQDPTNCSPPVVDAEPVTPAAEPSTPPTTSAPAETAEPSATTAPQTSNDNAPDSPTAPTENAAPNDATATPGKLAPTSEPTPAATPDKPAPTLEPTPAATPSTATGTVNGCNTYGQNCDNDPLYVNVPDVGYDWKIEPKITTVFNGTTLTARCWAQGGTTYNWAVTQNDPGPNPYDSDIYFGVRAPDGRWGFIPDTYFVRDKASKLGLPAC